MDSLHQNLFDTRLFRGKCKKGSLQEMVSREWRPSVMSTGANRVKEQSYKQMKDDWHVQELDPTQQIIS